MNANVVVVERRIDWPLALAGVLAAVAFLVDVKTEPGIVQGMLYIIPVVMSLRAREHHAIVLMVVICTVLSLVGFVWGPKDATVTVSFGKWILMNVLIWLTGALCLGQRRALELEQRKHKELAQANAALRAKITGDIHADVSRRTELNQLRQTLEDQEEGRKALSSQLGDGVLQPMGEALERLRSGLKSAPAPLAAEIERSAHLLAQAAEAGCQLQEELRPSALDQRGLVAAIEQLVAGHGQPGTPVKFRHDALSGPLSAALEAIIFHVARAVVAHAQCGPAGDPIDIWLKQVNGHVHLEVRQSGGAAGRPELIDQAALQDMSRRVRMLCGELAMEAVEDGSTQIRMKLPISHIQRRPTG